MRSLPDNWRIEIREYDPRDRRAVWLVHDRGLGGAWDAFDPEYNRYLRHVDREFADVGGAFLVADAGAAGSRPETPALPAPDSGVVGIGGFQPLATRTDSLAEFGLSSLDAEVDDVAQVRSVAVDPAWQGRGVGRRLMRGLESRASGVGFEHVVLQSPGALSGTHAFYESLGYDPVGPGTEAEDTGADYVWFHRTLRSE